MHASGLSIPSLTHLRTVESPRVSLALPPNATCTRISFSTKGIFSHAYFSFPPLRVCSTIRIRASIRIFLRAFGVRIFTSSFCWRQKKRMGQCYAFSIERMADILRIDAQSDANETAWRIFRLLHTKIFSRGQIVSPYRRMLNQPCMFLISLNVMLGIKFYLQRWISHPVPYLNNQWIRSALRSWFP